MKHLSRKVSDDLEQFANSNLPEEMKSIVNDVIRYNDFLKMAASEPYMAPQDRIINHLDFDLYMELIKNHSFDTHMDILKFAYDQSFLG